MKHKRINGNTALCIGLIILSLLYAVLFMEVDGETPTYEKGAEYDYRTAHQSRKE